MLLYPVDNAKKETFSVRDPFSSVLAEYNRRAGGHIGYAAPDKFKRENAGKWREFVLRKGADWQDMNLDWALRFKGPKLVIFYDELIKNLEPQLRDVVIICTVITYSYFLWKKPKMQYYHISYLICCLYAMRQL